MSTIPKLVNELFNLAEILHTYRAYKGNNHAVPILVQICARASKLLSIIRTKQNQSVDQLTGQTTNLSNLKIELCVDLASERYLLVVRNLWDKR